MPPNYAGFFSEQEKGLTFGLSFEKSSARSLRRVAGAVERGGLENRCTFGYPEFESLTLRHIPRQLQVKNLRLPFC